MNIITSNDELLELCKKLEKETFFTIDTEFLREKTYYPKLCLIQVALPNGDAFIIDPLVKGMDLAALFDLLINDKIEKVFHAARQDLEIFYNEIGEVPQAIFDTQVAAMVCGFGESIGYNNLISEICDVRLDKGPQFTDWSRRPLTDKQLSYAISDVTYLIDAYLHLSKELSKEERTHWVKEEMKILTSSKTYENKPEEAWKRIKIKTNKASSLSILQKVAAWREEEAQKRNVPRSRVLRDETIADIAVHQPRDLKAFKKVRKIPSEFSSGKNAQRLLRLVEDARRIKEGEGPSVKRKEKFPSDLVPVLEMLKMLLRIQASEHNVAAKLIASNNDLQALALNDNANIPALQGWRNEVFGKEALALKKGKIMLALSENRICKKEC
jgi:ribonuclease D